MKTQVYRDDGRPYKGKTMTVGDIRAALANHPDDMPVFGSWESISEPVHEVALVPLSDSRLHDEHGNVIEWIDIDVDQKW